MAYERWSEKDIKLMTEWHEQGCRSVDIAKRLNRPATAVRNKLARLKAKCLTESQKRLKKDTELKKAGYEPGVCDYFGV